VRSNKNRQFDEMEGPLLGSWKSKYLADGFPYDTQRRFPRRKRRQTSRGRFISLVSNVRDKDECEPRLGKNVDTGRGMKSNDAGILFDDGQGTENPPSRVGAS
jgi:hypothetical protein